MRYRILLLFLLLLPVAANAQRHKFDPSRYQAELREYITDSAGLTVAEADSFFPLYNELQDKKREIRRNLNTISKLKPANDSQYKYMILFRDDLEIENKKLEREYHNKFMDVISPQKLSKVLDAESRFIRKTFMRVTHKK